MLVQYQEYWTTYPAPEHGYGRMVLLESAHDLWLGGRHLAMSYKLKASVTYLNWIMHLRATACLHCQCTDNWPAKHRMAISHIAEVVPCKHRQATAAHYYINGQELTWPLFLYARYTSNVYFLSDNPYHLAQEGCDGRMDGQKLPNNCSNPSAYALRRGLIIYAVSNKHFF